MTGLLRNGVPERLSHELPRSPMSASPVSGRTESMNNSPQRQHASPIADPPPMRMTRKRAASLNTDNSINPRISDLALNSAGSSGTPVTDPTREQVCLCQPDPKIPRPRNGASIISLSAFDYLCKPPTWLCRYGVSVQTQNMVTSFDVEGVDLCSFHPIPPALPSSGRCTTSRPRESRDIQNHRRTVERAVTGSEERLESPCRGM